MFESYVEVAMDEELLAELDVPKGHRIEAKTRGSATLEELPNPDDSYPSLSWDMGGRTTQHFTCSCGEPLDDSARAVVNHLIDVGAYDVEEQ